VLSNFRAFVIVFSSSLLLSSLFFLYISTLIYPCKTIPLRGFRFSFVLLLSHNSRKLLVAVRLLKGVRRLSSDKSRVTRIDPSCHSSLVTRDSILAAFSCFPVFVLSWLFFSFILSFCLLSSVFCILIFLFTLGTFFHVFPQTHLLADSRRRLQA